MPSKSKKQLYLFSGLGADERLFQHLDFSAYATTFVRWIEPLPNESIEHYAKRLCTQIKTENPVLIGLSFGGIMAVEIARQIATEKVILLASAKNKYEIPLYLRIAGWCKLHKLVPVSLLKRPTTITYWLFGAKTKADKNLLREILSDTDPAFLKWAIDKIVCWKNKKPTNNIIHLHGSNDKILPARFLKNTHLISGGSHWMTMDQSSLLNPILHQHLS
jgi:pimeloyl-ACP methyl ester carboxylesterase